MTLLKLKDSRKDMVNLVRKNGYDIEEEAKKLQQIYLESVKQ